jgi:hypothetical protein
MQRWHKGLLALIIGAVAVFVPSTAHASNSGVFGTTFVDGAGALTDDFGDHYGELGSYLCNGCSRSWGTDLVMTWQAMLFSEGFLAASEIDGYFGPRTASATASWQRRFGIDDDGVVGPVTWDRADGRLVWTSSTSSFVRYIPLSGTGRVVFVRGEFANVHDDGAYELTSAVRGSTTVIFDHSGADPRIRFNQLTITRR